MNVCKIYQKPNFKLLERKSLLGIDKICSNFFMFFIFRGINMKKLAITYIILIIQSSHCADLTSLPSQNTNMPIFISNIASLITKASEKHGLTPPMRRKNSKKLKIFQSIEEEKEKIINQTTQEIKDEYNE